MIPVSLRAGSAYAWSEDRFPLVAGESLEYTMFNGKGVFSFAGEGTEFALSSADTANWVDGAYDYTLRAVDGEGNKRELSRGRVTILPNPERYPGGLDGRSHARRTLDAIRATLEGRVVEDAEDITIRGRTIRATPIMDLKRLENLYAREVAAEEDAERLANGLPSRRIIRTRFTNG